MSLQNSTTVDLRQTKQTFYGSRNSQHYDIISQQMKRNGKILDII